MAVPKAALFLINGFEETEAVATADILRRGGVEVTLVSLGDDIFVTSSRRITVRADAMFAEIKDTAFDMLVIPGGTTDYTDHDGLVELVKKYDAEGRHVAAICAAPAVLGKAGIFRGRRAACFPGMEDYLAGAIVCSDLVVTDGNITTARGPAAAPFFGLRLAELLCGREKAAEISKAFIMPEAAAAGASMLP